MISIHRETILAKQFSADVSEPVLLQAFKPLMNVQILRFVQ